MIVRIFEMFLVYLMNCPKIQNFSVLSSKRQRFLSIRLSALSDVSFLRNMLTVELYSCTKIIDVSPLHGIKNLILYNCSGVRDISCLGNHHRLTISNCRSIERGYECFRSVRHAMIVGSEVSDLSVFQETKTLRIAFFSSMESQLLLLKDIPELNLLPYRTDNIRELFQLT